MDFRKINIAINKLKNEHITKKRPRYFFPGYKPIFEKNNYSILKSSLTGKRIICAWNNVICAVSHFLPMSFYIYPNYRNLRRFFKITLCEKTFPGLIPDSQIANIVIMPFLRSISMTRSEYSWRVVVFTDKCQAFYNFPSKNNDYDGESSSSDIKRFVESEIWDLPGNKYPSKKSDCDDYEYFYPFLPDCCYEYHPEPNDKNTKVRKFKEIIVNGKKERLSRFYFPFRNKQSNPFLFMGGFEPDYKLSLFGTYVHNQDIGSRIVVFATSDGGKNIYAKYEFDDFGQEPNFGNPICFESHETFNFQNDLYMQKRSINIEKNDYFYDSPISIHTIESSNPAVIETVCDCDLRSGNIIKISGLSISKNLTPLLSNLYKVERLSSRRFALYELATRSQTALPCRHIHGINRIKDGWLISTGEVFPNGWLMYLQLKKTDTYSKCDASEDLQFVQINHDKKSIQRLIGCILRDDADNTLLFASDTPFGYRKPFLKDLTHSTTGIFKGKLSEVDDWSAFEVVCELKEPCYFFKELNGVLLSLGQRGEVAVSFDRGTKWEINRIDSSLSHYGGSTPEFHVIDGRLFVFK